MPAHDDGDLSERLGYFSVAVYAKDHPDIDGETIGRALTRGATKAELLAYAVDYVDRLVDGMRRAWARETEDRAAQQREPEPEPGQPDAEQAERDKWGEELLAREKARRFERYERMLADPARLRNGMPLYGRSFQDWQCAEFREYAGERFAAWHEQARALAVEYGTDARDFDAIWYPGGPREYWYERSRRRLAEAIEEWAAHIRLETTRELLGTLFALGDGTSVTWGAATVDQHEQRIGMLTRNATGSSRPPPGIRPPSA